METDKIYHLNFEEDFPLTFKFPEGGRPADPWKLVFTTVTSSRKSSVSFIAAFDGECYINCIPVDGTTDAILVKFKDHRLQPGRLVFRLVRNVPNDLFDDGRQKRVLPMPTDRVLWEGPTDGVTPPEIAVVLERLLKGDPGPAGPGVAAGGRTGQALFKRSDSDYDTAWGDAVRTDLTQSLSDSEQRLARENISAVGYLELSATLGLEAENWPLVLTSTLAEVDAAYSLFRAAPGRYRWSLRINSVADGNPFVEEAEPEPLHRDDGGLELLFTSKRSQKRYALVLTVTAGSVTGAAIEYRGEAGGQIVERIEQPVATLDIAGGHVYRCGEMRSLTIRSVEDSTREAVVAFRSGEVPTELLLPQSLGVVGYAVPQPGCDYEISIRNHIAVIVHTCQP